MASGGKRTNSVRSRLFGKIPLDFLVEGDVHPCPYIPGRKALEEAFWADDFPPELYHDFMDQGFRRSGRIFYRPVCDKCSECRPLRVVTAEFRPTKSQRRVLNKNSDVDVRVGRPSCTRDKLKIYSDYLASQHDGQQSDSAEDFERFLYSSPILTLEFEYRVKRRIVAVGIVDACSRSLSSVYAFFDPDLSARSLGTFSAIYEISFGRERLIPYYYLGFYVRDCPSMNYKSHFKPFQMLTPDRRWTTHTRGGG